MTYKKSPAGEGSGGTDRLECNSTTPSPQLQVEDWEDVLYLLLPAWKKKSLPAYLGAYLSTAGYSWGSVETLLRQLAEEGGGEGLEAKLQLAHEAFDKGDESGAQAGKRGLRALLGEGPWAEFLREVEGEPKSGDTVGIEFPWPSPLHEDAFYGLAGEVVNTLSPYIESDPVALLTNLLAAFGNVVGSKPHATVAADRHPCRFFFAHVGISSKARKGLGWGLTKGLLRRVDPEWVDTHIKMGLSSGEGLIWAVRNEIHKMVTIKEKGRKVGEEDEIIDKGVTDKRLLIAEGELSSALRVLRREGNILSPIIRSAWDDGNLQILTTGRQHSVVESTSSHISIIGHITKDELLRYLGDVEMVNGFANRFLWLCVKRSKVLPFGKLPEDSILDDLAFNLRGAIEFARTADEIVWAPETRPLWESVYPTLSEGRPGLLGVLTARSEAYVLRLSCAYALLDQSKFIEPPHLKAALAVWDYAEASVKYIFGGHIGDTVADEILGALRQRPEGMTGTEINRLFGSNKSSDQLASAFALLRSLGLVEAEEIDTGGRPKKVWRVLHTPT